VNAFFVSPSDAVWDDLANSLGGDVYHLAGYSSVVSRFQEIGTPLAFVAQDNDDLLLLPFIVREICSDHCEDSIYYDAISPYGYPGPLIGSAGNPKVFLNRAFAELYEKLRFRNIVAFFGRLHPLLNRDNSLPYPVGTVIQHGSTVAIDLSLSDKDIWAQLRSGHRNEINRARRSGHVALIDDTWTYWEQFLEIYAETMSRLGASSSYRLSREYFEELQRQLGNRIHLAVVLIDDCAAAAALFTESNGIVQYHLSGGRSSYSKHQPTKLMLHSVALWAKARGNRVLHLGGGLGGQEDSLFAFKAGFSKQTYPFYTWRLVLNQSVYDQLVSDWEKKSGRPADSIGGFFPAYRKPIF